MRIDAREEVSKVFGSDTCCDFLAQSTPHLVRWCAVDEWRTRCMWLRSISAERWPEMVITSRLVPEVWSGQVYWSISDCVSCGYFVLE